MNRMRQRGDTIVEVLLAVAIIGSVLGIAYGTMHRNLLTIRSNQERTEATRLGQGQVELLRTFWDTDRAEVTSQLIGGFCLTSGGAQALGSGAPAADLNTDDLDGYEAPCTNSYYRIAIRKDSSDPLNKYKVFIRWDRLGGGKNEVMMVYRLP